MSVDMKEVGRVAVGGGLTGIGIGSVLNLARHIRMMKRDEARRKKVNDTTDDTIVLTLPRNIKAAATTPALDKSTGGGETFRITRGKQARAVSSGKFGPKVSAEADKPNIDNTVDMDKCAAGWRTLTVGTLAALTSFYAGLSGVNAVYNAVNRKKLKREVDEARQEYIDALQSGTKAASTDAFGQIGTDLVFGGVPCAVEKDAEVGVWGKAQVPLAAIAVLSALGIGSTAYVTKKVLDEQFNEALDEGYDVPKVKRIMFKLEPSTKEENEKRSAAELAESENLKMAALATICIYMDCLSGVPRFTGIKEVKEALDKTELGHDGVMKLAMAELEGVATSEKVGQFTNAVPGVTAPATPAAPAAPAAPTATAPAATAPAATTTTAPAAPAATTTTAPATTTTTNVTPKNDVNLAGALVSLMDDPEARKALGPIIANMVQNGYMTEEAANTVRRGMNSQVGRWLLKKTLPRMIGDAGAGVDGAMNSLNKIAPLIEKGYNFVSPLIQFLISLYNKGKVFLGDSGRFVNKQLENFLGYKFMPAGPNQTQPQTNMEIRGSADSYTPGMARFAEKIAATPITTMLAGLGAAGPLFSPDERKHAKLVAEELERKRKDKEEDDTPSKRIIRIAASDPEAAEYVGKHIEKIKSLVARLSAQGTI